MLPCDLCQPRVHAHTRTKRFRLVTQEVGTLIVADLHSSKTSGSLPPTFVFIRALLNSRGTILAARIEESANEAPERDSSTTTSLDLGIEQRCSSKMSVDQRRSVFPSRLDFAFRVLPSSVRMTPRSNHECSRALKCGCLSSPLMIGVRRGQFLWIAALRIAIVVEHPRDVLPFAGDIAAFGRQYFESGSSCGRPVATFDLAADLEDHCR